MHVQSFQDQTHALFTDNPAGSLNRFIETHQKQCEIDQFHNYYMC